MARKSKCSNNSENLELEEAYRKLSGKNDNTKSKPHRSNSIATVICIVLTVIIIATGALFFYFVYRDMTRVILGNVSIAGIQLQGMTKADAFKAVEGEFRPGNMRVTVLEHSVDIPSDCIRGLRTRQAIHAAYNLGNITDAHSLNLTPYLKVDEDRIRSILSEFNSYYNTTLQESTYQVTGKEPDQVLQITLGIPQYGLDLEHLYQNVLVAYGQNQNSFDGECTLLVPHPIDLDAIQEAYCRPAIDASYDVTTHQIIGGDNGYGFDLEAVKEALETAEYGSTLEFPFTLFAPTVTRENAEASLFCDILGTYTAKSSSQSNRDTNLRLACEAINGIILYPGDTFSYNNTLGERTAEKGYRPAGTYVGNETVNTYGGGICQVSSSLYYSVLCAELTVIERTNHGFLPSYMPRGLDATVSWGTLDFRFKNTSDYPVRIEAVAQRGTTTVTLLGTETRNYRVELDATIIDKKPYATEYQVYAPGNANGYKDGEYIVTPHAGYYVKSYIYKYDKNSNNLISKEFVDDSNYRIRNAVICKIETTPGGETTPDTDTPETTDPPIIPEAPSPADTP